MTSFYSSGNRLKESNVSVQVIMEPDANQSLDWKKFTGSNHCETYRGGAAGVDTGSLWTAVELWHL